MYILDSVVSLINGTERNIKLEMDCCAAAGYTGRDQESVRVHIAELKRIGVPTPYAIPAIYWISPARLTTKHTIVVVGGETSPEVEFFAATASDGHVFITVASDHTDRKLEAVSVGKSKQVCDKILGDTFWRVDEIIGHWDEIQLISSVKRESDWHVYQKGGLKDILPLDILFRLIENDEPAGRKPSLLSGTVPLLQEQTIYTTHCQISMSDPVLNREIRKEYQILSLPDRS
ncbi:MAG: DUF2848 family protein [Desulfocapsaceae bacterium]|nr:DUF2848 family protein [Desulfocapsaceae bacterium]